MYPGTSLMLFGWPTALIFAWYLSQIAFAFESNSDFERREELPPPPHPASRRMTKIAKAACLIDATSVSPTGQTESSDRLELLERLPAAVAVAHASAGS